MTLSDRGRPGESLGGAKNYRISSMMSGSREYRLEVSAGKDI